MSFNVLALCLLAVVMSAFGQIALKVAVERAHLTAAIEAGLVPVLMAGLTSVWLWGALVIYGVSVLLWLWVLTKAELSLAYPLVSLGFVVTMIFASIFLHEQVTPLRVAGTLLIVAGCVLVGRSA